ncbi:hypothetical protein ACLG6S_14740 [Thermodesulfobacteriota bacterium B35]
MKRLTTILLLLLMAVILSGCGHHGMHGWMVDGQQESIGHPQATGTGTPA